MNKRNKWLANPLKTQTRTFNYLLLKGNKTKFGKDHHFGKIRSYEDFKEQVPIRDYEGLRDYIELMVNGKANILWPGIPKYLSKTSGTTSGAKYIPITRASLPFHIRSAKHALLSYIIDTRKTEFVGGTMIFLQGSPLMNKKAGIPVGRLSGIVAHHVPAYLQKNRMPSYETNCIEDWESKVDKIVEETSVEDMRLISGIPSWVQMYFERLLEYSKKPTVAEVFPNFSLFVYGGVNYKPYQKRFENLIGKRIDTIELYPASEGFIAYQDTQASEGMLLEINSGIFYEFIPADEVFEDSPTRIDLSKVELHKNYAIVLNTNAGLWGYLIGDTVKFVSKDPYRLIVTGRIKHFTSAFGEHVIAEEVEKAMRQIAEEFDLYVTEFHVAPQLSPKEGLPYHEWFIEFGNTAENLESVCLELDRKMCEQNPYYKDLIEGKVLKELKITSLKSGAFNQYMKSQGKLGGQNKVPRLANDRKIAKELEKLMA